MRDATIVQLKQKVALLLEENDSIELLKAEIKQLKGKLILVPNIGVHILLWFESIADLIQAKTESTEESFVITNTESMPTGKHFIGFAIHLLRVHMQLLGTCVG